MTVYAYLVERTDDPAPARRAALGGGTRVLPPGWDTRALAEELCREARVHHRYTTGPIRCSLWSTDGAEQFEYGRATTR